MGATRAGILLHDPNFLPADRKRGVTIGMAMTEKQGSKRCARQHDPRRTGRAGRLYPHRPQMVYSAPMSDAFLTLAYTDEGLTCFLVPRWKPDGTRNGIHVMRLRQDGRQVQRLVRD
ncbi:MAG: hypothetical protein R3B94_11860 [Hyphomonas sp.]